MLGSETNTYCRKCEKRIVWMYMDGPLLLAIVLWMYAFVITYKQCNVPAMKLDIMKLNYACLVSFSVLLISSYIAFLLPLCSRESWPPGIRGALAGEKGGLESRPEHYTMIALLVFWIVTVLCTFVGLVCSLSIAAGHKAFDRFSYSYLFLIFQVASGVFMAVLCFYRIVVSEGMERGVIEWRAGKRRVRSLNWASLNIVQFLFSKKRFVSWNSAQFALLQAQSIRRNRL